MKVKLFSTDLSHLYVIAHKGQAKISDITQFLYYLIYFICVRTHKSKVKKDDVTEISTTFLVLITQSSC